LNEKWVGGVTPPTASVATADDRESVFTYASSCSIVSNTGERLRIYDPSNSTLKRLQSRITKLLLGLGLLLIIF
jgi:hypothetical protein